MKGLVVRNTGSWYTVLVDDDQLLDCKIKGAFRLKGIRSTNPVAVGDWVEIDADELFITDICDRRNYIIRKSINLSKQSQIIASNVDQAFLLVTVSHPQTSTTFIDRFLASAEAYRVAVVLLFNKTDLLNEDELFRQGELMKLYSGIGYECLAITATEASSLIQVQTLLYGKVSVFSGHSGVGKSTLLNHFIAGHQQKTAPLSEAHDQGMHITTFSEMFRVNGVDMRKSFVIDTPGIRGFGTFDFEPEEVGHYFREIFLESTHCRFSNCTHTHEPGCAVLCAVEEGKIAMSRYQSYLSMLGDKEENRYRAAY